MSRLTGPSRIPVAENLQSVTEEKKNLGCAIWLLILLHHWKEPTDLFVRSGDSVRAKELSEALAVGERQALRDLGRLRKAGYVELQNTGRGFRIRLVD